MLSYLLKPISIQDFVEKYWDKSPLYIKRDDPEYYSSILTIEQIDEYLNRNDIRFPSIRMVKEGNEIKLSDYSNIISIGKYASEGLIDIDKIFEQFNKGSSFFLQMMRTSMPSLADFVRELENDFQFRIETHLLLTPRHSQGLAAHYDTTSSFIMQFFGSKTWIVYEPDLELPTIDQTFNNSTFKGTKRIFEVTLNAGDMIFLPRGFVHEAKTSDEMSLHMTTVLYPYTWIDIFNEAVDNLKLLRDFRKSSKRNLAYKTENTFNDLKIKLKEQTNYNQLIDVLKQKAKIRQVKDNSDRVLDYIRLPKLQPSSIIGKRKGIVSELKLTEKTVQLIFHGKRLEFPLFTSDAISFISEQVSFQLGEIPGKIDTAGKIVLVKKLIKEGYLKILINE